MKKSPPSKDTGVLAGLGVTPPEERIYIALLKRDGASAAELAATLRESSRSVGAWLESLKEKGLTTHTPAKVRRYFAVPPDIAVEALIERRRSELHHARSAIAHLREAAGTSVSRKPADDRLVEVLSSEASVSAISQMIKSARSEILCLERLPLLISPAGAFEEANAYTLARGVKSRAVTDRNLLRVPGMLATLRKEIAAGEDKRVISGLPFKLIMVDRRVGVVPLSLDNTTGPSLLVRSHSLLLALHELFEMFWRLATPYSFDDAGRLQVASVTQDSKAEHDQLLTLLASGLNDKTIERELDISPRTFTRRVTALMKDLGASTRFHAGWLAAKSGRKDGQM
jgi:sugar-specific transcriptional regulator TrmB/DNA-binding CsgD family transcriptional regulator